MQYDSNKAESYWNNPEVESMYDKHLLGLEMGLIKDRIRPGSKILDAGCGEGEGTLEYAQIPDVTILGADFSETRLKMATQRLAGRSNVVLRKANFLEEWPFDRDFDYVVSQRFLINITEWELQKKILRSLISLLRPGGRLLLLEGCGEAVKRLNDLRALWGLAEIPVKWHNRFLEEGPLITFMTGEGYRLVDEDGVGPYYFLTRGMRPIFDSDLSWDSKFNRVAASAPVKALLSELRAFSRLKLWVFEKP